MTTTSVESAVSLFGERTKGKLANAGASGQPEDQLRSPLESLLQDMSALTALAGAVEAVGESSVASLKTRPDYAVTVKIALVGFVELEHPVRALIRASSKTRMTRISGNAYVHFPTFSTRTATLSALARW